MGEPLVVGATRAILLLVPGAHQRRDEAVGGPAGAEGERCVTQALDLGVRLVAAGDELIQRAYGRTLRLNRAAAYESFCLALAESLGCELWMADQRLCNAVDLPWVHLAA